MALRTKLRRDTGKFAQYCPTGSQSRADFRTSSIVFS